MTLIRNNNYLNTCVLAALVVIVTLILFQYKSEILKPVNVRKGIDEAFGRNTMRQSSVEHVLRGDLSIIENENLRSTISKGPKYREAQPIKRTFKVFMDSVEDYARVSSQVKEFPPANKQLGVSNQVKESPSVNKLGILRAADVVSIPDIDVFSYDPNKAWITSDTCRTIDRKMYMEDFFRVPLISPVGMLPVYIHDPNHDAISKMVYNSRKFEPELLNNILLFLRTGDNVNFIDIGANIGLHTLAVVKMGRKVIALEAVKDNVVHICATTHDLGFQDNLRVIHNAVGSNHKPSMFHLGRNGTFGRNFVDVGGDSKIKQNKFEINVNVYQVKPTPMPTVTIDDLLSMPDQAFLKKVWDKLHKD